MKMSVSSLVIIVLSVVVVIFGVLLAFQSSEITDVFDDIPLPFGSDLNVVIEPASSTVGTVFVIRADLPKKETQDFAMRIESEEGSDFVVLYDDGKHFDFEAGDGIYKGFFDSVGKDLGEYEVFADSTKSVGSFKLYEAGCELVRGNPNKDKINFVILPSGYDSYEDFKKDAEDILSGSDSLMEIEPFKSNSKEFSFSLVNASGDLGCKVGCRGIDSIICCDDKKVLQEASQCHYDSIFILVNDDGLCGSASTYAKVCAGNSLSNLALVHELGHSFADLADEYVYADQYGNYDIGEIDNVNCAEAGCEKWADVSSGCYEGCTYSNLYRPAKRNSIMYTYVPVFNEVSKVHIEGLISDYKEANSVYYARPLPQKSYFVNLKSDNGSVEIRGVYLKPVFAGISVKDSDYSVQVRDFNGEVVFKTNLDLKNQDWPLPETDGILTHIDGFEYAVLVPYSVDASRIEVLKNNKLEANVSVEVYSEKCGDGVCDLSETHLDCSEDCDIGEDNFCETAKCDPDCASQIGCEGKEKLKWLGLILIVLVSGGIIIFVLKKRKEFLNNSGSRIS